MTRRRFERSTYLPTRVTQTYSRSYSELLRVTRTHSDLLRFTQRHPDLLERTKSYSDVLRVTRTYSELPGNEVKDKGSDGVYQWKAVAPRQPKEDDLEQ